MTELKAALTDRLRDEFLVDRKSGAELVAFPTGRNSDYYAAAILIDDEGAGVTVQALDPMTGELVWQVSFTDNAPLELILVTARSAADCDR